MFLLHSLLISDLFQGSPMADQALHKKCPGRELSKVLLADSTSWILIPQIFWIHGQGGVRTQNLLATVSERWPAMEEWIVVILGSKGTRALGESKLNSRYRQRLRYTRKKIRVAETHVSAWTTRRGPISISWLSSCPKHKKCGRVCREAQSIQSLKFRLQQELGVIILIIFRLFQRDRTHHAKGLLLG